MLVKEYIIAGLEYASLTDHNTMDGVLEAEKLSRRLGMKEFFPGMEIGCMERIHVLGLGLDSDRPKLVKACSHQKSIHKERARKQIRILEENNFLVDRRILEKEKGIVTEYEVFMATQNNGGIYNEFAKRWLYKKSPYYVKIERMSAEDAINLIHDSGGIAIWAHPGHTFKSNLSGISDKTHDLMRYGLDGLEVFSSKHDHEQTRLLYGLALKNGLAVSAGSDFHGRGDRRLGEFDTFGLRFDEEKLIKLLKK